MVTATTWVRDPASLAFVICEVEDPINVAAPTTRPVWHYLALEAHLFTSQALHPWSKMISTAAGADVATLRLVYHVGVLTEAPQHPLDPFGRDNRRS
jgi:hypothetical protein